MNRVQDPLDEGGPAGGQPMLSGLSTGDPYRSLEALRRTIESAREASRGWVRLSVRRRASALAALGDFLTNEADGIASVIAAETGKTRIEALATEVIPARIALSYYRRKAPGFLRPRVIFPSSALLANKWSRIHRVPYGVVGIIAPWNYPLAIPFSEIVMALLAGNGVVFKAARPTRGVAALIQTGLERCRLPRDLVRFLDMPGSLAGPALLGAGIDKLFFTGSVTVGKELMARAAETLTPVCLELGAMTPCWSVRMRIWTVRFLGRSGPACRIAANLAAGSSASMCTKRSTLPFWIG